MTFPTFDMVGTQWFSRGEDYIPNRPTHCVISLNTHTAHLPTHTSGGLGESVKGVHTFTFRPN